MTNECVESIDLRAGAHGWEPNTPKAVLISDDGGRSALALGAHPDDPDRRNVVLVWRDVRYASMGAPNDEALHRHRLYDKGLRGLLWLGVVRDSELGSASEPIADGSRAPSVHHVVMTKERVVEVVAGDLETLRIAGTTRAAATAGLAH